MACRPAVRVLLEAVQGHRLALVGQPSRCPFSDSSDVLNMRVSAFIELCLPSRADRPPSDSDWPWHKEGPPLGGSHQRSPHLHLSAIWERRPCKMVTWGRRPWGVGTIFFPTRQPVGSTPDSPCPRRP